MIMSSYNKLFLIWFLFALVYIGIAAGCTPQQVERTDLLSGEVRCCNPIQCHINEEPIPCGEQIGDDKCRRCGDGLVNPYSVHTRGLKIESTYCKEPAEYCNVNIPPEARRVNMEECLKTGDLKVECDRTRNYTGTDKHDCHIATVHCTEVNTELTLHNTCRRCREGYYNPEPGKGICIKNSSLSSVGDDSEDVTVIPQSAAVTTDNGGSDDDIDDESGPDISAAAIFTIVGLFVIFLVVSFFVACSIYVSRRDLLRFFAKCRLYSSSSTSNQYSDESPPNIPEGNTEHGSAPSEPLVKQHGEEEADDTNRRNSIIVDPLHNSSQSVNHPPANKIEDKFLEKVQSPEEKVSFDVAAGAVYLPPLRDNRQSPPSSLADGAACLTPQSDDRQSPPSSQADASLLNMDPPRSDRPALTDSGLGTASGNTSVGSNRPIAYVPPRTQVEHDSLNLASAESLNPNSILASQDTAEEMSVDGSVSAETYPKVPLGEGVHPQDQCSLDIDEATERDPLV